jgi:hypothetical protein
MPATIKRSLKSWMLVYVAFAVALSTADTGTNAESSAAAVSPGSTPSEVAVDRRFFRPTVEKSRRNDI